ncbi:ABC transporter ATP-binding protein [Variovorax sp. VNK109]|uniref:ABC transporter ATP-binding protein n=1 Tax=Variovorax sp. VNK109 TaxID=3400919 RepID=UPI003C07B2D3
MNQGMDIRLEGISRRFGAVRAVDGATLDIRAGRVLALLGENGAGKSTLMKVLYGVHAPDEGHITINGREAVIGSPREALAAGIGMVFQQFSLMPALTVRENLALALEAPPWWVGRGARRLSGLDAQLARLAPGVDPDSPVSSLPVGQMQLIELAKVLLRDARCVILDEPSAVLAPAEAQRLWQLIRSLTQQGLSVVLITHKLSDVRACADDVAVMRAGRVVAQVPATGSTDAPTDAQIVRWMVGEEPAPVRTPSRPVMGKAPRLELRGVTVGEDGSHDAEAAHDVSLSIAPGEIVGVAGISGSGQTALAEAIAGMRAVEAGEVILDGELLRAPRMPVRAAPNLGYIPPEPLRNAVAPGLSLAVNLAVKKLRTLPLLPSQDGLMREAQELIARFSVRPSDPAALAGQLSGGNLQKLVAARELSGMPGAVVACYPTMGLDVTATAQVYESLFGLAAQGSGVLWISEDLDDLLQHAHRIAVMHAGRIVAVVDAADATAEQIGAWMTGHVPQEVTA